MALQKQSLSQTLKLIVDILNFECRNSKLESQLILNTTNWDAVVTIASKHLVLTAVYCRLKQRELLNYLPEELVVYLAELTELNRIRNTTLLKECTQISELFNQHHINHVFIKGIALLGGNYYKDIGERMIGDIDILVGSEHLNNAFDLLFKAGYSQTVGFNYKVKNFRHLPRQISKNHLGAVELHGHLLKHNYNHLIYIEHFLANKKSVDGIAIPSNDCLVWNLILAHQINDHNAYLGLLKLRSLYDVLVLKVNDNKELLTKLSKQKYSRGFLSVSSVFIPSLFPTEKHTFSYYQKRSFEYLLKYPRLGGIIIKMKLSYLFIKERIMLSIVNKSYRNHIVKSKWIK